MRISSAPSVAPRDQATQSAQPDDGHAGREGGVPLALG
ncbi:hypothetical protein I552_6995 [Mycobacterium xenopi 3993]|nr:hypothetical protein I552_6995 [Mycobacterium xenopi 3993]